jgi:hypothetical protein
VQSHQLQAVRSETAGKRVISFGSTSPLKLSQIFVAFCQWSMVNGQEAIKGLTIENGKKLTIKY